MLCVAPARADPDPQLCATATAHATREAACSRIIATGSADGVQLNWAYANRCKARHNVGLLEGAAQDCLRVLASDPSHWQSLDNLAITYRKLGLHMKALDAIEAAMKINPGHLEGHLTRANVLCALGRSSQAVQAYRQALRYRVVSARRLQVSLKDGGFYAGRIDGKFGPKSRAALDRWAATACN